MRSWCLQICQRTMKASENTTTQATAMMMSRPRTNRMTSITGYLAARATSRACCAALIDAQLDAVSTARFSC